MPWKDGYTISDEKTLFDDDIRWPGGKRMCMTVMLDLSLASGPQGLTGGRSAQFQRLSLPFIPSVAETLEFCITTGYPFRHA